MHTLAASGLGEHMHTLVLTTSSGLHVAVQGQQREQRRKQLGVADRAMYSLGQLVFQNPAARLLALCYLLIMHILVFASLTHVTHRTSDQLVNHHQLILDHRHDLTSVMHHDGSQPAAASMAMAVMDAAQKPKVLLF